MIRRFASPKFLGPVLALGAGLGASLLAGCLGGDLDTPTTAQPVSKDTVAVKQPPKDTIPTRHDTAIAAVHSIYPRLKIGEKWIYSQYSGTDTGSVYSAEVIGESTFGNDSVYIERISFTALPYFADQSGTLAENYMETGLIYARKSDQETVHDSLSWSVDLIRAGDTVAVHYHEDDASVTRISGSLPDSLKAGAAWKLTQVHSQTIRWSTPDTSGIDSGTDTHIRTYLVKAPAATSVKAGTFPAFEIDEADSGSTTSTQVWFAPTAKAEIRQIDTDTSTGKADTTELSKLLLK